jgi:hypothetical protein
MAINYWLVYFTSFHVFKVSLNLSGAMKAERDLAEAMDAAAQAAARARQRAALVTEAAATVRERAHAHVFQNGSIGAYAPVNRPAVVFFMCA